MDSRLRRRAVFLAVSLLILAAAVVAVLNKEQFAVMVNQIAGEEVLVLKNAADKSGTGDNQNISNQAGANVQSAGSTVQKVENGFVQDVLDENGMIIGSDLSAFMSDETFFDPEKPGYTALLENETRTLSMMATSVEKDLRVIVVDGLGRKVRGQSLYVTLEKDGIRQTSDAAGTSETDIEQQSRNNEQLSGDDAQLQDKNLAAFSERKQAGEAMPGDSMGTTAQENGGYKDLDQDGMIYIGGLKPGRYTLTLQPVKGYEIAEASLPVSVKDKLEYRIIDDISAYIKTEDEIDASKEDTEVNGAGQDIDGTEETALKESDGRSRAGIDVSKWNKDIDWARVKAAGVDFAIIRCGYRGSSSGVLVEDPYFLKNIEGAKANGISVGVYFFTQATTEVEAVEEASMAVSLCRDYKLDYPVFIDTEGAGGNGRADGLGVRERTAVCRAFCETVESAGLDAGVYASRNWWYNNLTASELAPYTTWLAEYRREPLYTGKYQIWQYTSNGNVDGIDGRVDLNVSYLGY